MCGFPYGNKNVFKTCPLPFSPNLLEHTFNLYIVKHTVQPVSVILDNDLLDPHSNLLKLDSDVNCLGSNPSSMIYQWDCIDNCIDYAQHHCFVCILHRQNVLTSKALMISKRQELSRE